MQEQRVKAPENTRKMIDMDGDGRMDLLAANYRFKYEGNGHFRPIKIADVGGRIAAGRLIKDARYP